MELTFEEYQETSVKTLNDTDYEMERDQRQLVNMAMGLSGETIETSALLWGAKQGQLGKELGDVWWYTSVVAKLTNFVLNKPLQVANNPDKVLVIASGDILEHIKKHAFHGHDLNLELIHTGLYLIMSSLITIAQQNNLDTKVVWQMNIDKLQGKNGRYKDGFSKEKSINRNEQA